MAFEQQKHVVYPNHEDPLGWVTGVRFYVNLAQRTVTFSQVRFWKTMRAAAPSDDARAASLVGSGWKLASPYGVPDYVTFPTQMVVGLYEGPQPEWSGATCDWQKLVANFRWHVTPGTGGGLPEWDNSGVQNSWRRYYCNKGSQYYCN